MITVLIVEDQEIVRNGLKMIIEQDQEITVVAEAENGLEALKQLEIHMVDIVLLDIRMPVMDGIETTRMIKRRFPNVKILILTTFNDEEYAVQSLKEGANGFLLKTSNAQMLVQSIKSCLAGGMSLHDEVAAKVIPTLLKEQDEPKKEWPLTKREFEIVRLIALGKTNKEIASDLYLSVGTIKNHLTQILNKLELRDRTQLAIFAVKNDIL